MRHKANYNTKLKIQHKVDPSSFSLDNSGGGT